MDGRTSRESDGQFDGLLRSMLASGLVERRSSQRSPLWQLSPLAQRRLETLACARPPAEKVIFFGHHCVACGELRPTRFRWGRFMCDPCLEEGNWPVDTAPQTDVNVDGAYPEPPLPPARHHLAPVASRRVRVLEFNGNNGDGSAGNGRVPDTGW